MITTTNSHPFRRPRFQRVETPPPFRVTARDIAIVHAVARFRFLTSTQIIHLTGGSAQQILRRLQLLFHHGFLDRPKIQSALLAHVLDLGNQPFAYGLGQSGANLLAAQGIPIRDDIDWATKNKRAVALFLAHTIDTAESVIAFELACREHEALELIDHHDLLPDFPEETRGDETPFQAHVRIKIEGKRSQIGIVPDRLFSLARGLRTRSDFALECDRGTMDIKAKKLIGKSSYRKKLIAYYQLWKDDLHTKRWGFNAFRVLTITSSEKRMQNMIAVQREIVGEQGSNLFLFTTPERLKDKSPLADVWVSGKGETIALLP
jgi:hypothetical protein